MLKILSLRKCLPCNLGDSATSELLIWIESNYNFGFWNLDRASTTNMTTACRVFEQTGENSFNSTS